MGRPRKRVMFSCQQCGKEIELRPCEVVGRRFCGAGCQGEANRLLVPSREVLYAVYWEECKSTPDLARMFKVSKGMIYNWLKAYEIPTRTPGQGVSIAQTGKQHTEEHCAAISEGHKRRGGWQGRDNPCFKNGDKWKSKRSRGGFREDLGFYVRSAWEANICRLLNWRQAQGEVICWQYEPETFEFVGIKRGTRFYTPDFKVTWTDGRMEYQELKGYMDARSKTKLRRMAKYYPKIPLVLIDSKQYREVERQFKRVVPNWE